MGFLNGDSFLDAVFANGTGGLGDTNQVCLGDGLGGFSCSDVSADVRISEGVALGLVNGDSFLDAVFANRRSDQPNQVCFGDGTGGFSSCADVSNDMIVSFGVALGLVNDDNFLDAVFANDDSVGAGAFPSRNTVCFGDGMGGFTSPCSTIYIDQDIQYRDVALGDVDDDGFLDAAFGTDFTSGMGPQFNLVCTWNELTEVFDCIVDVSTKPVITSTNGVALGSLNVGNSFDEIVFANGGRNVICFPCIDVSTDTNDSQGVALGLVDGDGFLDAVFANEGQRNRVCIGNGAGGFSSCAVVSNDFNNSRGVALGDFNPTGCCEIGVNDCVDDQNIAQCDAAGGSLDVDTLCDDIPECNVPPPGMGCCVIGDNDCIDDQTMVQCDVEGGTLQEEVACSAIPQCNIPPPGEGCCVLGENNCIDNITMTQCEGSNPINFVLETDCDFVPTCNVPPPGEGCCVLGDNNCLNDQTEADCTGEGGIGFELGIACSAVPQCIIPPAGEGCCVLGVNDCINDQTENECNGAGGAIDIGLSCSAVPTCNNVMPPSSFIRPIPTISQLGLIVLAGILGIVGLIAISKKYASVK